MLQTPSADGIADYTHDCQLTGIILLEILTKCAILGLTVIRHGRVRSRKPLGDWFIAELHCARTEISFGIVRTVPDSVLAIITTDGSFIICCFKLGLDLGTGGRGKMIYARWVSALLGVRAFEWQLLNCRLIYMVIYNHQTVRASTDPLWTDRNLNISTDRIKFTRRLHGM